MNRILEEKVEGIWQGIPTEVKRDIENSMGFRREEVSAYDLIDIVLNYTDLRLDKLRRDRKQREEQDMYRKLQEGILQLKDESNTRLEKIFDKFENTLQQTRTEIEDLKKEKTPIPLKQTIMMGTAYLQDCKYSGSGPTQCVHIFEKEDGRHVQCQVAVQFQSKRILPRWLTTTYGSVKCPSDGIHRFIRPCRYLDGNEHIISEGEQLFE